MLPVTGSAEADAGHAQHLAEVKPALQCFLHHVMDNRRLVLSGVPNGHKGIWYICIWGSPMRPQTVFHVYGRLHGRAIIQQLCCSGSVSGSEMEPPWPPNEAAKYGLSTA